MKFALIANNFASFVLPMAEGLKRMLGQIGVGSDIYYYGLRWLTFENPFYTHENSFRHRLLTTAKKELVHLWLNQLEKYDAIIFVNHMPTAFMKHLKVELVRKRFPNKPIVLYDLIYLPTLGKWGEALKTGNPAYGIKEGGHYGMERYDWYLLASVSHEYPLDPNTNQPYSLVGLNLNDGTLYPEQKERFIALLDFERPDTILERSIQIRALKETNTEYMILSGQYSIREIREIYRKCSIFFVSWRESFGLPICELQACGSYIFTPYARWCPSHWMKNNLRIAGPGDLSPNFIVYNNDKDELVKEVKAIKESYDPIIVFDTFTKFQHHLYYGDLDQLIQFVEMIESGQINSLSHKSYKNLKIIDEL